MKEQQNSSISNLKLNPIEEAYGIARSWEQNPYFDEESRQELKQLLEANKTDELFDRFYKDVEFGTGGLRALIGIGRNRINKYTVRKATQALASSILHFFPASSDRQQLSAVVSYDSRHYSKEFAEEVCGVMAGNGIKAYLFSEITPTPILSYAIRKLRAKAGVMITASHNPPEYNGYKAYWGNGAQVIPPFDDFIMQEYAKIDEFSTIKMMPLEQAKAKGMLSLISESLLNEYYADTMKGLFASKICREYGAELRIAYSPLHGAGYIPCTKILKEMGFSQVSVVESQAKPDGQFPTVQYPNPEEKEALKLVVELMHAKKAHLAFATDPDSDRLGVVVNLLGSKNSEGPVYLNGNQIAVLLLDYILTQKSQMKALSSHSVVIKSIVTTDLLREMAQAYGVKSYDTLTGFKWMCGYLETLQAKDPQLDFVFASEESFGYLVNGLVRDKDAVSAMALFSEMALVYLREGKTVIDRLEAIFERYGHHEEGLLALTFKGHEGVLKIERIMETFRKKGEGKGEELAGMKILRKKDFLLTPCEGMPASNVLSFELEGGDKILLRPSGTEPKIKFYFLVKVKTGTLQEKQEIAKNKIKNYSSFCSSFVEKV
jgi:phosphoglucomutase